MRYDRLKEVCLDRTMMSWILLNLALNAANAGACKISIDIWRTSRLGVIDIADDGPEIPREHRDSLLQAFHSKQRGGTGLGLAIARDLAMAHSGALKLDRGRRRVQASASDGNVHQRQVISHAGR